MSAMLAPATLRRRSLSIDEYLAGLPDEDRPVFDQSCGGFVICSRRELGVYPRSYRHAVQALALARGVMLVEDESTSRPVSPRLRGLEWGGCVLGLMGAAVLATNTPISRYGWISFLGANFAMIGFARGIGARGLLLQQVGFMATSILGLVRSFGLGV